MAIIIQQRRMAWYVTFMAFISLLENVAGATVWGYDLVAEDPSPVQRHFIMVKEAEVD